MRVRTCRVRRPDDVGHHDPPGEEETGLHPRAHPDRGDLLGGPGASSRGTDEHISTSFKKKSHTVNYAKNPVALKKQDI